MTTDLHGAEMQRRTATAVMTRSNGLELVVERTEAQYLSKPDTWKFVHFEVMLLGPQGLIGRFDYPGVGLRGAHFRYAASQIVRPPASLYDVEDIAWYAAYQRFRRMDRMIRGLPEPVELEAGMVWGRLP